MIFRSRHSIGKVSRSKPRFRSAGARAQASYDRKQLLVYWMKRLLSWGAMAFGAGVVLFGIMYVILSFQLPSLDSMNTYLPAETTKILSADGVVLADLHQEENRDVVRLEHISPILKQAVVAIEDRTFYDHHGISIFGIIRATVKNAIAGSYVEGASTLTQQLARNIFLSRRKTLSRKLSEVVLSIKLENKFSKDEILEMYLNQVYWGHNAYGIESASQLYFGKHAEELNLSESALLVGMLKGPELYSPFRNYPAAKLRQHVILKSLANSGLITPEESQEAYAQELALAPPRQHRYKAPYFTSYIVQKLISMYGEATVYTAGMKVYTTLNYKWQMSANDAVAHFVEEGKQPVWTNTGMYPSANFTQAALLSIEPTTGYIKAMQGGVDYRQTQFNRTTQSKRQPGSAFKPFVYLAALQKGFSPGTIVDDSPITFSTALGPYTPQNYTHEYLGKIPLRKALERSVNIVAIKINQLVGPENVVHLAHQMGIKSPLHPVLSLPLGANEVSMMELTSAYCVLANGGRYVEPTGIIKIEDREGAVIYRHSVQERKVVDADLIAVLVDMMKGVVKYGTGQAANIGRPVAGKTGTTSDYKDAWFVGFVPQLVTAVWVGNDDNRSMAKVTGGSVPALIWKTFMLDALADSAPLDFPTPRNLVTRKVNWRTGALATEHTPSSNVHEEKYFIGNEPQNVDKPSSLRQQQAVPSEEKTEEVTNDFLNL